MFDKKEYQRNYYQKNKDKISKQVKQWKIDNPEYNKQYYIDNKEKIKKHYNRYRIIKRRTDIKCNLNNRITTAINISLKGNKNGLHWESLLDYTQKDLRTHLEKQFKDGMNWENYGKKGWVLDHKIPVSLFNIKGIKSKGFKQCWALENLQPMWEKENIKKSNNLLFIRKIMINIAPRECLKTAMELSRPPR